MCLFFDVQRQLPRTEKAVQKASLERREIEGATRKTERDLRVEKLLSRQRRRSEKMDVEDEDDNELQKEENTTQMLNIQHDFDTIKSQTSAADTNVSQQITTQQRDPELWEEMGLWHGV